MTSYQPPTCPVCHKTFQGSQGLGGHLKHNKDPTHIKFRKTGQIASPDAPSPDASPTASHQAPASSPPTSPPAKPMEVGPPDGGNIVAWGLDRAAEWMKNKATQQAQQAKTRAPPPPQPPAQPKAPPQPQAPAQEGEMGDDAYWRKLLGTGYRPRNQGGND